VPPIRSVPSTPEAVTAQPVAATTVPDPTPTQAAVAAPATAATAASAPLSADATPTDQVAPALVRLIQTPNGGQRLTLHLEPASLGHVQIQIDRPADAAPRVDITVQRPQTLELLLRDQPQLQRALDQAGVPQAGRTLTLHLASPNSAGSAFSPQGGGAGDSGSGNNQAGSGWLNDGWAAGSGAGGQGAGSHGSGGNAYANGSPRPNGNNAGTSTDTDLSQTVPASRWVRAGLDITA
jgi:hypothetical protein